jgi:hypothetical protein
MYVGAVPDKSYAQMIHDLELERISEHCTLERQAEIKTLIAKYTQYAIDDDEDLDEEM